MDPSQKFFAPKRRRMMDSPGWLIGHAFSFLLAILVLKDAVPDAIAARRLIHHGQAINAVVIADIPVIKSDKHGSHTEYATRFRFLTPNERFFTVDTKFTCQESCYPVNATIPVHYDPQDPTKAVIDDAAPSKDTVMRLLIGSIILFFPIANLAYRTYRERADSWLQTNGLPVQAQFLRVQVEKSKANAVVGFRVHCEWRDPALGTVHHFESESYVPPVPSINPNAPITVLVDPQNYNRYFVDISSIRESISELTYYEPTSNQEARAHSEA